jgi:hypothetical protein
MRKDILLTAHFKKSRYGGFLKAKIKHMALNIHLLILSPVRGLLVMIIVRARGDHRHFKGQESLYKFQNLDKR